MTRDVRTLPLGEAIITVINVGDFTWNLSEKLNVSESEWRPQDAVFFERPLLFPTQCVHIALPHPSVLVDPSRHDPPANTTAWSPNLRQPPRLITQLLERGIHPEEITHVVITHAHFDHYAAITREQDGYDEPCFPNARCFLSRAEWERPEIQQALQDPDANESRTLGVLHRMGALELVEGDHDLVPGVRVIAAPGETPGHQIVRVHSQGQTLYCLGDLYHHPVEVEHPTWMVRWKNREVNLRSRQALMEMVLAENALLIASHIPPGYMERTSSGVRWIAL